LFEDFVDFGLGLLDDFDERIFMRELGRTGVAGVSGSVSGPVLLRLKDKLRLMPAWTVREWLMPGRYPRVQARRRAFLTYSE
jgi:hypothetical protein